jgi:hypothetical protein
VTDIPWQPLPPDPLGPWDDLPAHSPARPPADFRPAPPAESFHQPLPPKAPAEVGYLRFHMQRTWWITTGIKPILTLNGTPVKVKYGENTIPLQPGRYVVEASQVWRSHHGHASYPITIEPGEVVDVWYAGPATQYHKGSIGPSEQQREGLRNAYVLLLGVLGVLYAAMFAVVLVTWN